MSKIIIGPAYLHPCEDDKVQLCADITINQKKETLYYEVDTSYQSYLCVDRADPFLLGLINTAMYDNDDIMCVAPVSQSLLFQLKTFYIPILSDNFVELHPIQLDACGIADITSSAHAVGTGNSGGVDSFYTLLKYRDDVEQDFRVTHTLFSNISTQDTQDDRIRAQFESDCIEKSAIAQALGLQAINVYSNLYQFYRQPGVFNYHFTAQYVSCAYLLIHLFSVFYFSSGVPVHSFSMNSTDIKDGAYYDLFTCPCLSGSGLRLYSAGSEVNRLEKTRYISTNACVQQHLQVCSIDQVGERVNFDRLNCGACPKCRRSIVSLYALGVLERFRSIFNMQTFDNNPARFIAEEIAFDAGTFTVELYQALRQNALLPRGYSFFYFLYHLKYKLRKITCLRKIYRKLRYHEPITSLKGQSS